MATQHTHGRGGAGNVDSKPKESVKVDDLQTPSIKQSTYTTGRGGSGNMASNDSADSARKAQDVEALAREQGKGGTYHFGRGGEGNLTKVGDDGKERRPSQGGRKGSWVKKGKDALGLGNGKAEGSAIED